MLKKKGKPQRGPAKPRMTLSGRIESARAVFNDYPRQFWILVGGSFIDRVGGALLFPFFSLYITKKFEVGMTEVGLIFGLFSLTGLLSNVFGGALTDRMGRKGIMIFGLVMSALSALLMGLINDFWLFIGVVCIVGMLADVGFPAQQAMVADLLPEDKRAQGYGIIRVVQNLAVTIGPMIGGLLAAQSYLLLFVTDAVASLITATFAFFALKETRKPTPADEPQESMGQTFKGYGTVLRDSVFTGFLVASMVMVLVYMQMNTTLAVYLRDSHGINERMFGYILSLNAAMVVLFQFPITRWISKFRPMNVMVAGTLLYAVGFAMYGFVSTYVLFLVAMVIITIGEMLDTPVSQAIVSGLAPESMRGRYMAAYGFSWVLPSAIGPLLAGLVIDNLDPRWVWYGAGILGVVAAGAFYFLEWQVGRARWSTIQDRLEVLQQLEDAEITAAEAVTRLNQVTEGRWAKLAPSAPTTSQGQVRIRVADRSSGSTHSELVLPLGLLNTILNTGARLSPDLDPYDTPTLRSLISRSVAETCSQTLEPDGDHRVEVSLD